MSDQVLQALAQALAPHMNGKQLYGLGQKADGTPYEQGYIYEQGGLFGRCDGPSQLINALVGPVGFEGVMNWYGTDTETEIVDALSAISESGNEQNAACGDCITPSPQACAQNYCFGRFCRQSQELQFDRLGVRANDNVPTKALFGDITDAMGNALIRQGEMLTDGFMLQSRLVGYFLRLKNSKLLWSGDPANNNGRIYMEPKGFDLIINTGKFDLYTQQYCTGLDSLLLDYLNNNPQSDGALAITNYFRRFVLEFTRRAEGVGLDWASAQMYIVMTPNMWDCIARAYACAGIDLCSINNATMNVENTQASERYEEYLTRMALPIMGRWYPVILDSQISETAGQANGICSDIYFITTRISGEEITYGQYQDFGMTYGRTRQEMTAMFGSDDIAVIDNGRYALVRDNSRGCFDIQGYLKPRIVAKMPFLLGRLQNVCCNILDTPLPDVSGSGRVYEKTGGRTTSPIPTLYGC